MRTTEIMRSRRSRRWAALAAAASIGALASTACSHPGGAATGIRGRVTQSPCGQPVEEGKPPCPDPPVVSPIEVYDAAGVLAGRTQTDARGYYGVRLAGVAGAYTVKVALGDPLPTWPKCPDGKADVVPGQVTRVDILCGSGAR
jgi:hypothetical protein